MSLYKISDLEGVDINEISAEDSLFHQYGLFEVSNPVTNDIQNMFSYKSQYIRVNTLIDYIRSQISSFDHNVTVTNLSVQNNCGLSGDFTCNDGNYPNTFNANLRFNQVTINTPSLSVRHGTKFIATYSDTEIDFHNDLNMQDRKISLSSVPTDNYDVTNKKYIDDKLGNCASCNYQILTCQPTATQLAVPNTFYFVIENT